MERRWIRVGLWCSWAISMDTFIGAAIYRALRAGNGLLVAVLVVFAVVVFAVAVEMIEG